MTNELAEMTLTFCRECLGWEDAAGTYDISTVFEHLRDEPSAAFRFTDLNAVMEAVRGWCKGSLPDFYVLDVTYYMPKAGVIDDTFIVTLRTNRHTTEAKGLNLCHALLSACVEANRKLKASA